MPRRPRRDTPGSWHHVVNRAIGRRTMFETAADAAYFLSLVARQVRAGRIAVVAYSILSTHFHLLLISLRGELAVAMKEIENRYVRWFNRTRRRDGTLVRGRYASRRVDSDSYRRAAIAYIDRNAVEARIQDDPRRHAYASAAHYARARGPRWLSRDWVEAYVRRQCARSHYVPADYMTVFHRQTSESALGWSELVHQSATRRRDRTDRILRFTPARVLRWMRAKARLADGTAPCLPLVDPAAVRAAVSQVRAELGALRIAPRRQAHEGWGVLEAALLRDLCACTSAAIAAVLDRTPSVVRYALGLHRAALDADPAYRAAATGVFGRALQLCHGADFLRTVP